MLPLAASILFPPLASLSPLASEQVNDALDTPLPGHAVCVTGPLPASCLYHIALNHLRLGALPEFPSSDDNANTSFDEPSQVLILTPDRAALHASMVNEPDAWLAKEGGKGNTLQLLDLIEFK